MILSLIIGFISGIAIGSLFHISPPFFVVGMVVTGMFAGYRYFVDNTDRKIVTLCAVLMIGVLIGVARINFSNLYSVSNLEQFVGQSIVAEGIIVAEPDVRERNVKLTVELNKVILDGSTTLVKEKILVTTSLYPEYSYGDKVKMQLILEEPQNIESDNGKTFDYLGYLRVRGIWYTSNFVKIELLSSGNGNKVKEMLFRTKNAFTNSLNNALPEPESSLMAGLLLGTKQSLGKELLTEFQKTGTSHIVVLSGYNIAIIAESIMGVFNFLPKTFSFGFGAVSIILFTMLSGGGASAWRAAIMVLVALSAKKLNRDYKASRAFGFAVIIMLAPNPLLLIFDPSFQLSVLATIGIIFVAPFISPYFKKVTEGFGLREIISTTIATQITVLPYLVYNTGLVSVVSLPVNVLILGTIPITMFFGFLTGITGIFSLYLSFIPAFFAYCLLWYQLFVIHLGATFPLGTIKLPSFSFIILIFVYSLIFSSLYFLKKKTI